MCCQHATCFEAVQEPLDEGDVGRAGALPRKVVEPCNEQGSRFFAVGIVCVRHLSTVRRSPHNAKP
jgi:hypothetical protein